MLHNKYFEIYNFFLKSYNNEYYGRELAKKLKISQKNIALTLNDLEKEGILTSITKGNTKYFSLNKRNDLFKRYIHLAEVERSINFLKKHPKIAHIFKGKKEGIICIFGSYAKEEQRQNSDLDILLIGSKQEKEITKQAKQFNLDISIKKGSKNDFKSMLKNKNPLINEIIENHIIITGFEEFIEEVTKWLV